ncbi:MAG: MBL fold metallo-hydrolase [Acidobacteria bacterium]|nr:MAG: MBL fold metallo-hydrolase [Acidobacteriota bacterium]
MKMHLRISPDAYEDDRYNSAWRTHMNCHRSLALLTVVMLTACARQTPEQQIVHDAAAALGGVERLQAVSTVVIEGEGTQYNLGQDVVPNASGQMFAMTEYKRAIDVAGERARTELVRVPKFTYWQGLAAQRQIQGIDKAIGYNVAPSGTASRIGQAAADDRRAELLRYPITAVRAALDPAARLTNLRVEDGQSLVEVLTSDGRAFTLAVDEATKLPTRVATAANHVNLGDVVVSTAFAEYQNVDGVQLPARLTTRTDDFTTGEVRVTRQAVDTDTGDLAAPAAAASAAVPAPQPPTVTVEEVSRGVWLLAGGSHHSALIEFADHLLLIDAPQNDARALAVIAKARELRPGKPVTHVVNSHHHFDHSGGIRAAVAEGLTVITHQGNAAFIEDIVKRPHTRVPDALAKNPKPLKIETVSDEKVITDGTMTVHLYPAPGEHSETMLMAYLPRERALVVIDLYEPGEGVHMFAARFLEDLEKRNLRVDRIVPLHGKIVPYAQLVKDATAAPAS